jgi:hypothetical protein
MRRYPRLAPQAASSGGAFYELEEKFLWEWQ